MPDDGQDLECHPVSVPPSPSSVAGSVHGHALSHVTYSPSRCNPLGSSASLATGLISHGNGLHAMNCGMQLHALARRIAEGCTWTIEFGVCTSCLEIESPGSSTPLLRNADTRPSGLLTSHHLVCRHTGSFRGSGSGSGSIAEEPWAPDMQAVAEGVEERRLPHALADPNALSFRPGLTTEPSTRLTQVPVKRNCLPSQGTATSIPVCGMLRHVDAHLPLQVCPFQADPGHISAAVSAIMQGCLVDWGSLLRLVPCCAYAVLMLCRLPWSRGQCWTRSRAMSTWPCSGRSGRRGTPPLPTATSHW